MSSSRQWLIFALAALAFFAVVHVLILSAELANVESSFHLALDKSLSEIEQSSAVGDTFKLRRVLEVLKDSRIDLVELESPSVANVEPLGKIVVGKMGSSSLRTWKEFDLRFSGADLGQIRYSLSLFDLSTFLVVQNAILYAFLILIFAGLVAIANSVSLLVIRQINQGVQQLTEISTHEDGSSRNLKWSPQMQSLAQNLDNLLRVKKRFAEGEAQKRVAQQVAHDIRSPLGLIRVFASAFKMGRAPDPDLLQEAATRIESVLEDLVESSLNMPADFSLAEAIEVVIREKAALVPSISFVSDLKDCRVYLPKAHFQRSFANFTQNAIDALEGRSNGKIQTVMTSVDEVCEIRLTDNGKGVSHEVVAKLNRGEMASSKSTGYGLGFSGSKKMIEAVGGTVRIETGDGTTTVILKIPIHRVYK